MSRIYLCVEYQGKWKKSDNGWEWNGSGCLCKGFIVETSLKMEEFVEKIYEKTGIKKNEYSIEVTHKCPGDLNSKTPPILISDDSDLDDFFSLYAGERAVTVYVEVKAKTLCLAENDDGDDERNLIEDDYFGLDAEDNRVSPRESPFGCYGLPLQICRGMTSNEPEIGSNTTPTTTCNEVETSIPEIVCNEVLRFDSTPAIDWNQAEDDTENVEDGTTHSHFHSESSEHANRRHDGSDLCEGQHFDSKSDLNYKLNLVAIEGKFEMKISKSTTTLKEVKCIDEKCSWRVRAVKMPQSNFFVIRRYNGFHTCTMMTRSIHHKQATSRVIATRMQGHFNSIKSPPKPKMVAEFVRNELKLQCSYWKAWKAKKVAQDLIRGTPEHNFAILPSYCYMLKMSNAGTVTHIKVDEERRFKYFFMALGAQIRGFSFMRKVIGIDGAWIKTKFKGVLLVASTQDSEYHTYPIAWGLVDSENNAAWTWFLEKLKGLIPDCPELCFISDRSQSIEHAVKLVYPQAKHGACYFHVKMNIRSKFKSCASHLAYKKAAEAYTFEEFNKYFNELRGTFPRVAKYLEEEVKFEKWSRANFEGNRYEVMTTNIVETVNHMMNEAREYPITALIDFVLESMGQWFLQRRSDSLTMENLQITPEREKILRERWNIAGSLTALQLNAHEFYVKCKERQAVVNLGTKRCECKVFDIEGIPCVHAIAAAGKLQPFNTGELIYSLCSKYYSVDYFLHAYAETIYPVAQESQWSNIPEEISSMIVRMPEIQSQKGRPRLTRFPSRGEVPKKQYKCSACNRIGHSRRTCTNNLPADA